MTIWNLLCPNLDGRSEAENILTDTFSELAEWGRNILTSIDKMQSNANINTCIAKRCFYIASLNNDMFRPLYRPSSRCTFTYFKENCTI